MQLGVRPLLAHCQLGLDLLFSKVERRDEPRPELAAAIDLSRSKQMIFWLPRAEPELVQVSS